MVEKGVPTVACPFKKNLNRIGFIVLHNIFEWVFFTSVFLSKEPSWSPGSHQKFVRSKIISGKTR
jgi:hypothetical protein